MVRITNLNTKYEPHINITTLLEKRILKDLKNEKKKKSLSGLALLKKERPARKRWERPSVTAPAPGVICPCSVPF